MLFGIDVAKWQGSINWAKVKKDFAILKITDKSNKIEAAFETNYEGCKNNNIQVGVYRYVYAQTVAAAEEEAKAILKALKGKSLFCGIWLDVEDSSIAKLGKIKLTDIIEAEAQILRREGYHVGIYCNLDWYKNIIDGDGLSKKYPFWIARYPVKDSGQYNDKSTLKPDKIAKCWQYSSKGQVKGIKSDVDLDVAFESFAAMFASQWINLVPASSVSSFFYPRYLGNGTSIVSALQTVGEKDTSFCNRRKIAHRNGILNYSGTAKENLKLIDLIKAGKLVRP